MSDILKYHMGDNDQYQLVYIHSDQNQSQQHAVQRMESENIIDATVIPTQLNDGTTRYPVYVLRDVPYSLTGIEDTAGEEALEKWVDQHFTGGEVQVLAVVLDSLNEIIDEKIEQDERLKFYKQSDLDRIPQILDSVEWGNEQTVGSVGAQLLSEFILTHPLPNTNHRTALTLLDRYLTTMDRSFEMPDTGETGHWYPWIKDYIHESKRLTTLRRKSGIFVHVQRLGFDVVERKGGIQIHLDKYPIERSDSFSYFTQEHHILSEQFVSALATEAGVPELIAIPDDGKQEFFRKLAGSAES